MTKYCLRYVLSGFLIFLLSACTTTPTGPIGRSPDSSIPPVATSIPKVREPWAPLARELVAQGLPAAKVSEFFNAENLTFTSSPMEAKLRELYGIYFKSELTRVVQEKLYQLGYDLTIDGRKGSGTLSQVKAFQKSQGLEQNGQIDEGLLVRLNQVMKGAELRPLSGYRPPAPAKPSRTATHNQFTNAGALAKIRAHYFEDKELFDRMERSFQVPGPLVASIMWIETGYGSFFGKNRAAASLASMAASANFTLVETRMGDLAANPEARAFLVETAQKRGAWARDELVALLKYAWANNLDPISFPGSIYGAIGYGQFMPSNVAKFAADGDGDRRIDLFNKADAIYSIGRFLKENGWQGPMNDEEQRRAVIMRYNKSGVYVNTVLYVAEAIAR